MEFDDIVHVHGLDADCAAYQSLRVSGIGPTLPLSAAVLSKFCSVALCSFLLSAVVFESRDHDHAVDHDHPSRHSPHFPALPSLPWHSYGAVCSH